MNKVEEALKNFHFPSLFKLDHMSEIQNLVFQGGGVKGLAYLGVLEQLETNDPLFFSKIKRIAGTSAGSIVALYLGLNMNVHDEIKPLLERNYLDLLDDELTVRVLTNPGFWKNTFWSESYKKYRVKHVIEKTLKLVETISLDLASKNSKRIADSSAKLKTLVTYFVSNFANKLGTGASGAAGYLTTISTSMIKNVVQGVLGSMKPVAPLDLDKLLAVDDKTLNDLTSPEKSAFEKILEDQLNEVEKAILANTWVLPTKTAQENQQQDQQPSQDPILSSDDNNKIAYKIFTTNKKEIVEKIADKEVDILGCALGDLLYFLMTLKDGEGKTRELGLFHAKIIKKVLIEDPMLAKIKKVVPADIPIPTDLTFEDLDNLNKHIKDPEQKFRKFYVTAFNTETCKTEVFSLEHTPKVVIADAVRASMSIPIFFTHVTIREKNEKTGLLEDRRTLNKKVVVHYLDGGLLDNYPIWLFDDFKYILNAEEDMQNDQFSMQNPYTLGFRLVDQSTLFNYVNPSAMSDDTSKNQYNSFFSQLMMIASLGFAAQENEHIKRHDNTRTVYIDSCNISPVAFDLTKDQQARLVEEGRRSVQVYKARMTRKFRGEGQIYKYYK